MIQLAVDMLQSCAICFLAIDLMRHGRAISVMAFLVRMLDRRMPPDPWCDDPAGEDR